MKTQNSPPIRTSALRMGEKIADILLNGPDRTYVRTYSTSHAYLQYLSIEIDYVCEIRLGLRLHTISAAIKWQ